MTNKKGWIKDRPDDRDYKYVPPTLATALPSHVDLRSQCPPVYHQGQYNSCTGNAISGAFQFELQKLGLADFVPSRLFIYYNERAAEGTLDADGGAQLRTGMKVVNTLGVCHEVLWPYESNDLFTKPLDSCYQEALNNVVTQYVSLQPDLMQLKTCVASGCPFVFGIRLYPSFETADVAHTGFVPMPVDGEEQIGGHALMAVGYDDLGQNFIVRNSWGADWGDAGYCYLPYGYITNNLASDFWAIQVVK